MSADLTGKPLLESLVDPPSQTRLLYPTRKRYRDLDPATLQVLIAVELSGQAGASELAQRLRLEPPSVSGALATLRERGLLRPVADEDARKRPHRTTAAGRRLIKDFAAITRGRRQEL